MPKTDPAHSSTALFEQRKRDHIAHALDFKNQAVGLTGLDQIQLRHEALPDLNFDEIKLETVLLNHYLKTPFFISSMTAGHAESEKLNHVFAKACALQGWAFGVGSQRRELFDESAGAEWKSFRSEIPDLFIFGNIGISQLIQSSVADIQKRVESLSAKAMAIHLNPLQECLQAEGTPQFKGGLLAIERLVKNLNVPVIVKETGCGMNAQTIKRLNDVGVHAIDISGLGGTHWGRIEGARNSRTASAQKDSTASAQKDSTASAQKDSTASARNTGAGLAQASDVFADWGIGTVASVRAAKAQNVKSEIWASGGVRSGLDAAKLIALGANAVGFAQAALAPALKGPEALVGWMKQIEFEFRIAMFCTGSENIREISGRII